MGKNRKKRSRPTASTNVGSWKSVSVTLSSEGVLGVAENDGDRQGDDVDNIETSKEYSRNHYDDPKLFKKAELDLPMDPGEDCGMFFGLEVLDASQYRVENTGSFKRLIVTGEGATEAPSGTTVEYKAQKNPEGKNNAMTTNADTAESQKEAVEKKNLSEPKKKKRKKKKDKSKKNAEDEGESCTEEPPAKVSQEHEPITREQLSQMQSSWSRSTGGAHLHNILLTSLHRVGFATPTPIQAATLSASTMGRRNLVGAAPTGSGKTLAFLLPILNNMLQKKDEETKDSVPEKNLQALIMTPTRGKLSGIIRKRC
jgi:hypothetical protein